MQRDKAIRTAFFQALDGEIDAPVFDSKVEGDVSLYVILGNQTASLSASGNNYNTYIWQTTLTMEIVSEHLDGVTKDTVDEIEEQIANIIIGDNPQHNGLIQQAGWIIELQGMESTYEGDTYLNGTGGKSYLKKILTFTQTIELT